MQNSPIKKFWFTYAPNNSKSSEFYDQIISSLSANGRYFHNTDHIFFLLKEIDTIDLCEHSKCVLVFAAFYHDVIYVPGSPLNELFSAKKAKNNLKEMGFNQQLIKEVVELIIDTKTHLGKSELSKLFGDMDMAILGQKESLYLKYVAAIRKEYGLIPGKVYLSGRKKFLQNCLKQKFLFQTDIYRKKLEAQARFNIENELKTLEI